jgi:hypothetical protein
MTSLCPDLTLSATGDEELRERCLATPGGGAVHQDNLDKTWTVEGFSDEGHMKGFRYVEDPDVMALFSTYQRQAWQQCASTRNTASLKTKDLREAHHKKVGEIGDILRQHYSRAYAQMYQEQFKEAKDRASDASILRDTQELNLEERVTKAVISALAAARETPTTTVDVIPSQTRKNAQLEKRLFIQLYPRREVHASLIQAQGKLYNEFQKADSARKEDIFNSLTANTAD